MREVCINTRSFPWLPRSGDRHLTLGCSDDEPFCGRLEIVNAEVAPSYNTLSFTWGTDDPSDYIWIEGRALPIRPNLEPALHSLRFPVRRRRLWIGALCVDQSNLEERSRQVIYMSLTYKHCVGVMGVIA